MTNNGGGIVRTFVSADSYETARCHYHTNNVYNVLSRYAYKDVRLNQIFLVQLAYAPITLHGSTSESREPVRSRTGGGEQITKSTRLRVL